MACPFSSTCLGLCEWTGCPGADTNVTTATPTTAAPTTTMRSAITSHTSCTPAGSSTGSSTRFAAFVTDEQVAALSKGVTPANTDKTTKWAMSNFEAWKLARNQKHPDDQVPDDLFMCTDPAILSVHLSRFVLETRKSNSEYYPPKTLYLILCGILRHMRSINPGCVNFLDKKDVRFKSLHGVMDAHFHQLHSTGIGRDVKHARVLTTDDEERLWKSGVMGTKTPKALQNAAFFIVGKMFCLRGGVELRELKPSQIKRHTNPDRYIYSENVSKNCNGIFKLLNIANKVVPLFSCPEAGERCPVHILDVYFRKLPKESITKDIFFFRPLEKTPSDPTSPWYSNQPVGKHTLEVKLSRMCSLTGIEGRITNHSLRATAATQLYEMGVPEKVIQERTGHRSLDSLRVYERTSTHQQQAASNILSSSNVHTYAEQVQIAKHHSQTSTLSISPSPSSTVQSLPIYFGNLYGCTININASTNPQPSMNFTQAEVDEIYEDF